MSEEIESIGSGAAEPPVPAAPTAPPERPPGAASIPRALAVLMLILGIVAFRELVLWDPGRPGLPDLTWFFFGWADTSPQIVFAIVGFLLFRRRRELAVAQRGDGAPLAALPLLLAGCLFFAWGRHVSAGDLVLASLIPVCLGAALLISGPRLARLLLPPLLILLFAIPLPGVVSNHLVYPLQLTVAEHATRLLSLFGIEAIREGDVIYLSKATFEVIESCSGMRSIQVLTLLAIAWACFFRVPLLHGLLLVAAAPLIAYGLNLVRVMGLVLYPTSEAAAMHSLQGMLAFLGGSVGLYVVDGWLRRFIPEAPTRDEERLHGDGGRGGRDARWRPWALAAVLTVLVAASFCVPRWSAPEPQSAVRLDLPDRIEDWRPADFPSIDHKFLGRVGSSYSKHAYHQYEKGGERVAVFIGYDDRMRRDRSLLSAKNALPGRGWEIEERGRLELAPGGPVMETLQARTHAARMLSYHWYQGAEGVLPEALRAWLGIDQSVLRGRLGSPDVLVVRLTTRVDPAPGGMMKAEARLREVARLVLKSRALAWWRPS